MNSLLLFILCFMGSCGLVLAALILEIATFTRSNTGLEPGVTALLYGSSLLGLLAVLLLGLSRRFGHARAVGLGLLPVAVVALLVFWIEEGTRLFPPAPPRRWPGHSRGPRSGPYPRPSLHGPGFHRSLL